MKATVPMFTKALAIIVFVAALAVALLAYRQQRFESMHEMAQLHARMNARRQAVWDHQARIAARVEPLKLTAAIERARLDLEPAAPGAAAAIAAARMKPGRRAAPARGQTIAADPPAYAAEEFRTALHASPLRD